MFFLYCGKSLYKWKIFFKFEREPIFDPDASLAGRKSKGEIRWSDEFAGRLSWFLNSHTLIISLATDNC
jgi:hypothetical protein